MLLFDFVATLSGSIIVGIVLTILITGFIWWDSREKKLTLITFIAGLVITMGGVVILYMNGYYS